MNSLKTTVLSLLCLTIPASTTAQDKTIKEQMDWLHKTKGVNFVYDSSINLDRTFKRKTVDGANLNQTLKLMFEDADIEYEVKGKYVVLKKKSKKKKKPQVQEKSIKAKRSYTLSGYIKDQNGETLINATIRDDISGLATTTNSYGFFSLTLPEGSHRLRCSYIGFQDKTEEIKLNSNKNIDFILKENATINEVVVTADLNSPVLSTQTGKLSIGNRDINTEFAMLSSADVAKTLQRLSGVNEGIELTSGLYVHGGNNDENLILLDGTPLYQISHALGLFSSFNTDVIKNVDFFKSGFPARYGGRLSSVIDVRTKDGDFYNTHGGYRIGIIDGSLHLEGPLQKGKTSYNIGLRRSWLDIITRPAFAIYNRKHGDDEKLTINYFFHDLNAKVTNIFNNRSRMSLSLYSGEDIYDGKNEFFYENGINTDFEKSSSKLGWGNFNMALDWNYVFTPKFFANFTVVYTYNRSKLVSKEEDSNNYGNNESNSFISTDKYSSTINDIGYRTAFDYRPQPRHHIRFGNDYTWHTFRPQTISQNYTMSQNDEKDTYENKSKNHHSAHEWNFYAEDEFTVNDKWSINGGINSIIYNIGAKTFFTADPRMAVKFQPDRRLSVKGAFTMMSQFVHKISNSIIDIPTDYWVSTTKRTKPMRSMQFAAGIYFRPDSRWLISLEGYYKKSLHILQYSSWARITPPAEKWDMMAVDGKGRFYGMEFDAGYKNKIIELHGSYTLSWNERKFTEFYPKWFPDKFDNRHKINITARWNLTKKISTYAAWSYHTGNHLSVPTHQMNLPEMPSIGNPNASVTDDEFAEYKYTGNTDVRLVYEKPSNYTLPAYHRLDIGFNFSHKTKKGNERIWNLSFYNAYCHLNTLWAEVDQKNDGQFYLKNKAFIPVIPSFSYTYKF